MPASPDLKQGELRMSTLSRRDLMSTLYGVLAAAALSPLAAAPSLAQGAGAVVPLPAAMAAAAQQYLTGVVGEPVPASPSIRDLPRLPPEREPTRSSVAPMRARPRRT